MKKLGYWLTALCAVQCGGGGGTAAGGTGVVPTTTVSETWSIPEETFMTEALVTALNTGELYFNVHDATNPAGAIRGQINVTPAVSEFDSTANAALLSGDQQPEPVDSEAIGAGVLSLDPATGDLSGVLVTRGIVGTAAHIHDGAAGVDGPVIVTLSGGPTVWTVPEGTSLTAEQVLKSNNGELYCNVHSEAFPGGEIRGQLGGTLRFASLSGANEVPPVSSSASGVGVLIFNPLNNAIDGVIQISGLTATQAHIHVGAADVSGPVAVGLTEVASGSGVWRVPSNTILTEAQSDSLAAGDLYFNAHSTDNPGGEIRGQIVPAILTLKTATLTGAQEVPPVSTAATGSGTLVLNSVTLEAFGDVAASGITGEAAHVHQGAVGVSGPVVIPLTQTTFAPEASTSPTPTY